MTISTTLYSSRSEEWPTPRSFFDELDQLPPYPLWHLRRERRRIGIDMRGHRIV